MRKKKQSPPAIIRGNTVTVTSGQNFNWQQTNRLKSSYTVTQILDLDDLHLLQLLNKINLQLWELGFSDLFTDPVQELGTKQETGLSGLSG